MKKRVAYIIMTVMLLLLTIGQTVIPAFAGSTKRSASDASQLSSTIDYSKALSNSSSLSEVVANSQTSSQSSATTSSSQPSSKASVGQSTTSSKDSKTSAKKAAKTAASQSIMLKATETPIGTSAFPDYSNSLMGQERVISVDPVTTNEEIPAGDSAFPKFIPGVSTIDLSHMVNKSGVSGINAKTGFVSGNISSRPWLDNTEDHYITFGRVMNYTDAKGNAHSIDIREEFMQFEKRGWYLGTKVFGSNASWQFGTGIITDPATGTTANGAMFTTSQTLDADMFMPEYKDLTTTPIPTNFKIVNDTPNNDQYQYNQPVTIKLKFIDHDTQQPIKVSGFITLSDMDHRDYIDFDNSSNIKNIYTTNTSILKGTMAGTGATIVNQLGNWDYSDSSKPTNTSKETGTIDYPKKGMPIDKYLNPVIVNEFGADKWVYQLSLLENASGQDPIKDKDMNAWTTVVYEDTDELSYRINDTGKLSFLPTAIVPVAFTAPVKSGDEATYSSAWDDKNIEYDMTTMLPYRGGAFDLPNPNNYDEDTSHDTFKPAAKFVLSDPVDQNLTVKTVKTVKIFDDTNTEATDDFTITKTDGKVIATAKDTFLSDESNYAKAYTMKITTTVVTGADLSGYEQVDTPAATAQNKTYAKIPNTGHLTVIKKAGATEETLDSNEAYGYVKTDKVPQQKATVKQEIKNDANDSTWQAAETDGEVGDKIDYRFTVKSDAANTDKLTKAKIQSLSDNSSDLTLVPGSLKVQIDSATATAGDESQFNKSSSVDIGDMAADTQATVTYQMTVTNNVTADKDVINEGSLFATNLDNLIDKTHILPANDTTLHLKKQRATIDQLSQTVENITTSTKPVTETDGSIDDVVRYTFRAHVKAIEGATLKKFTLTTQENDTSHTDADGALAADADQNDLEYQVIGDRTWHKLPDSALKAVAGGVQITLPDDEVNLRNGNSIAIRYSKSIKTLPAETKYLYNDGTIGDAKANYTRIKPLSDGKITVRYLDRESDMANPTTVSSEVTYVGKIGTKLLDSTTKPDATGSSPKTISGWTVVDYTGDTDLPNATYYQAAKNNPVFAAGDQVITYRYEKKALSLVVPTHWYFGAYGPSDTEQTYYLKSKDQVNGKTQPYELQVRDYYGVNSWSVDATQSTQFKTTKDVNGNRQTLTGAQLQFKNGTVLTNQSTGSDAANPTTKTKAAGDKDTLTSKSNFNLDVGSPLTGIMSYEKAGHYADVNNGDADDTTYDNPGTGEWHYQFGTDSTKDTSIGLHVPSGTKRYEADYATTITWNLNLVP